MVVLVIKGSALHLDEVIHLGHVGRHGCNGDGHIRRRLRKSIPKHVRIHLLTKHRWCNGNRMVSVRQAQPVRRNCVGAHGICLDVSKIARRRSLGCNTWWNSIHPRGSRRELGQLRDLKGGRGMDGPL
jgi:hypothetical protein